MAKQSQSWKNLERKAAKLLEGQRVYRGANFSESLPDVSHPYFGIECKYRTTAPVFYYEYINVLKDEDKHTIILHKDRVVLKLSVLAKIWAGDIKPLLVYTASPTKKYSKFLEDSLTQASKYNSNKTPLLIYKRKNAVDEMVYMKKEDFYTVYDKKLWESKLEGKIANV